MEDYMMIDDDEDEVMSKLEQIVQLKPDTITKAHTLSFDSSRSTNSKPYLMTSDKQYDVVIISFPPAWSVADFFDPNAVPFGLTDINRDLFPSLKYIGLDKFAKVNKAFQTRFINLLNNSDLYKEIEKARMKKIVFTGRSSGASVAMLATLWLLETRRKSNDTNSTNPICLTFGAPLLGDKVFHHAIERQNWSCCFVNFVMISDLVPRVLLAPLSSINHHFQSILDYLNPNHVSKSLSNSYFEEFYLNVMINASATVSHAAASELMECTNLLINNLANFNVPSPYRPFGTFVFLNGNQTAACVLRNSDAVMQLLFYCCQIESEEDICNRGGLKQQMDYPTEVLGNSLSNNIIDLDFCLENLAVPAGVRARASLQVINNVLDDLGVSRRGRICLLAAQELKKQKENNLAKINMKKHKLTSCLNNLIHYKAECELRNVCYYDAFKLSTHEKDFKANEHRLQLASIWDEIIDMLKTHNKLPENFEGDEDWIRLGTEFRRIMEPLDIANYYRHDKFEDTGSYLDKGRPKRYRFTQKWLEHLKRGESSEESCIFAKVEEFRLKGNCKKEQVLRLEKDIEKWIKDGVLTKDVFSENSTFVKWWCTLSVKHREASSIKELMPNAARAFRPS